MSNYEPRGVNDLRAPRVMSGEERADRIAELYEELAHARDAVADIESELRALGEEPVS